MQLYRLNQSRLSPQPYTKLFGTWLVLREADQRKRIPLVERLHPLTREALITTTSAMAGLAASPDGDPAGFFIAYGFVNLGTRFALEKNTTDGRWYFPKSLFSTAAATLLHHNPELVNDATELITGIASQAGEHASNVGSPAGESVAQTVHTLEQSAGEALKTAGEGVNNVDWKTVVINSAVGGAATAGVGLAMYEGYRGAKWIGGQISEFAHRAVTDIKETPGRIRVAVSRKVADTLSNMALRINKAAMKQEEVAMRAANELEVKKIETSSPDDKDPLRKTFG